MAQYIINGGKKLEGKIKLSGNKNSVFPVFGAALLTSEEVILNNIPDIVDTKVSLDIFKELGCEVSFSNNQVKIKAENIKTHIMPNELTKRLRGSVVFAGGLLGRVGKVEFCHPGGDVIGKRSIDTHLEGFRELGFEYEQTGINYKIYRSKTCPKTLTHFLDEASVTATENLILASVLGESTVILKNCAKEPHIVDLCKMLNQMGANIEGVGNSTLVITGVGQLSGTEFTIASDYLEFGTYAIAAAITKGEIEIEGERIDYIQPISKPLEKMGLIFEEVEDRVIRVSCKDLVAVSKLVINIWPGFPTDVMSLAIVLATQAKGVTLCHDWMYESRMFFVDKLINMGAHITIADPHRVVVYGPTQLYGKELETPDIRAGMALVLAALVSKGESKINRAELIERGYENVVEKLRSLGADIKRLD